MWIPFHPARLWCHCRMVYLPMSYQLGGFTVIVPAENVRELAMTVEEALRFCVTAGVSRTEEV